MSKALIGLGSNLGDRAKTLASAAELIGRLPQSRLLSCSQWLPTAPVGGPPGQGEFLNAAVVLETGLSPQELHAALLAIELKLGRERQQHWAARTLDLDLLLYDDLVLRSDALTVPHPAMAYRRFVLAPAAEIAADWTHPIIGWTIGELLNHLDSAENYIAIAGPIGAGKTQLARAIVEAHGGHAICDRLNPTLLDVLDVYPSRYDAGAEIRLLDWRKELLDAECRPGEHALVVSDFWFEQSLAYAAAWLPLEETQRVERHCRALAPSVIRPKLLVLLDIPEAVSLDILEHRGQAIEQTWDCEHLASLRASLLALASRPGVGPVVLVDQGDQSQRLSEVLAAIESMR